MRDPNYARFTGKYGAEDDTEFARNVMRHKQESRVIRLGKGERRWSEKTGTM